MATSNREGRRRRVLREDAPAADSGSKSRSKKKARPYSDAALVELQPRITDLIPDRISGLLLVLFLGIVSAAVVQTIYHFRVTRLADVDYQVVSGLNLYGPGTFISWLSSVYLLMAGGAALLVYNTRRHKIDDYFGRYSLWIWMAAACILASLDATTGLHRVLQYGLMNATGTAMWGDGSIWWIAAYALLGLVVGGRALLDMWPCRGALFLGLAAGCYILATTIYLGVYRPDFGQHNMTLHSSSVLLGHFFVLYSFLLYARYIHRVAQGMVGKRKKSLKQQAGWWSRQQARLSTARQERAAARLERSEAKAELAAAKRAAKAEKIAERETTRSRVAAEREAARAASRDKALAIKEQKVAAKAESAAAAKAQAAANAKAAKEAKAQVATKTQVAAKAQRTKTETAKRSEKSQKSQVSKRRSPIDVRSVQAKTAARQQAVVDENVDDMTVEELEMELLTNPNLSKNERRRLRKRLKEQQSQQRQAA